MALITQRTVFIHLQKTGGMTVRAALHQCRGPVFESGPIEHERHIGLPALRVTHPGLVEGRKVFGCIRHPVAWLQSRWSFAVASGFPIQRQHRPSAATLWLSDCWAETFEEFVRLYLERQSGALTRHAFHALGLWSDRPADFIARTEDLIGNVMTFLDRAGEVFPPSEMMALSHRNRTPGSKSRPIPDRLRQSILAAERPLVELWEALDETRKLNVG